MDLTALITFTTSLGSNRGVPLSSTYNSEINERCQLVVPVLSGKQGIILYFSRKKIVRNCWPVTGSRKGLNCLDKSTCGVCGVKYRLFEFLFFSFNQTQPEARLDNLECGLS